MKNLRDINLTNNGMTSKGIEKILPSIKAATHSFTFANNKLKPQGALILTEHLIDYDIR